MDMSRISVEVGFSIGVKCQSRLETARDIDPTAGCRGDWMRKIVGPAVGENEPSLHSRCAHRPAHIAGGSPAGVPKEPCGIQVHSSPSAQYVRYA
jgi:hypothetical protein